MRLGLRLRHHDIHRLITPLGRCSQFWRSRGIITQSTLGSQPVSSRKQVTVANDDGRIEWRELSVTEKAARTAQQTLNFGVILTGLIMTGGCAYFLYKEVFASDSKTSHFNQAVDRIRADPRANEVLGSGHKIKAFGEPTFNKWARARPIASTTAKDSDGTTHCLMHFNVEGSSRRGVVQLHKIMRPGQSDWEYEFLYLDIKGHPRIYLENSQTNDGGRKSGISFLGMSFRK
ncbi:MAG: hypothetical protein LQ351_003805 [Letrouitia transgressa]|nr:MAG: hypothetical protein LQ351_003805 [Letrouitia transgressa]